MSDSDALINEAITWFARLRADDVSDRDRERFFDWLRSGTAHQQAFIEVLHLWEGLGVVREMTIEDLQPFPLVAEFKRRVEVAR